MTIIEEDYEIFDNLFYADLPSFSSFKDKMVEYIGGFVMERVYCVDISLNELRSTNFGIVSNCFDRFLFH